MTEALANPISESPPRPEDGYRCEDCGQRAILHIMYDAGHSKPVRHLCLECADTEQQSVPRGENRVNSSALLMATGAIILVLSVFADQFGFGRSLGFGPLQIGGLAVGLAIAVLGSVLRIPTLLLVGAAMAFLSLMADILELGSGRGFGLQQATGSAIGAVMLLYGGIRSRIHRRAVTVARRPHET